jgi:hypothetical protein
MINQILLTVCKTSIGSQSPIVVGIRYSFPERAICFIEIYFCDQFRNAKNGINKEIEVLRFEKTTQKTVRGFFFNLSAIMSQTSSAYYKQFG